MTELQARLDEMREAFASKVPARTRAIMQAATEALQASGQAERALAPGHPMPAFQATAHDGRTISSDALLAKGALVLTFFRGHW